MVTAPVPSIPGGTIPQCFARENSYRRAEEVGGAMLRRNEGAAVLRAPLGALVNPLRGFHSRER